MKPRELARWYRLKDHPTQMALVHDDVRFKVAPAGRRSGKTERAKRYVIKQAMKTAGGAFFLAAPTRDQAKRIFWKDSKLMSMSSTHKKKPSESELIITLNNDATINVIGLDRPERFEGQVWDGGVVDEIGNIKPESWEENIRPALDTYDPTRPDYLAWCWLIGVPEGMNHYYDLAEYARTANDPDWKLYHWKSSDILPANVIASAKRQMSARQFRQEYEASFETATGRIYEDYGDANFTSEEIQPHEQLCWYHDFNYTPMSSGVGVIRNNKVYLLDEIILTSAISRQSALEFVDKYKAHKNKRVLVYGDPAGRAGEKHGHVSDYSEIQNVLRSNGWAFQQKVRRKAPSIKDRQNSVRAMIKTASDEVRLYVNPKKAPYTHKGLATVEVKKGSTFLEEDGEFQHITTAIGYFLDVEFPSNGKEVSMIQVVGN